MRARILAVLALLGCPLAAIGQSSAPPVVEQRSGAAERPIEPVTAAQAVGSYCSSCRWPKLRRHLETEAAFLRPSFRKGTCTPALCAGKASKGCLT